METGKNKEQLRTFFQSFWWNMTFPIHVSLFCSGRAAALAAFWTLPPQSYLSTPAPDGPKSPKCLAGSTLPLCIYLDDFLGHLLISHQLMQHMRLGLGLLYIKRPLGQVLSARAMSEKNKNQSMEDRSLSDGNGCQTMEKRAADIPTGTMQKADSPQL